MTAKQQLLERAPNWTEAQGRRALDAAEGISESWGELEDQSQQLFLHASRALDAEEQAAGLGPWPGAPKRPAA
jgi:hypothetical protein